MRLIGMILALGAISWTLYQLAGGDAAETAIPEPYQKSLEKARGVEQTMQEMTEQRLGELDGDSDE